jgi:hypothetical protein
VSHSGTGKIQNWAFLASYKLCLTSFCAKNDYQQTNNVDIFAHQEDDQYPSGDIREAGGREAGRRLLQVHSREKSSSQHPL